MKHSKKTFAALLLGTFLYSDPASAYVFSFTNGTNEPIAVDVGGVAVIGSSLMQGKINIGKYEEKEFGKTRRVNNAGHLSGPQKIEAGATLELNFDSLDLGVCLDTTNLRVGLGSQGFSMISREVVALPNQYYDSLFSAVNQFGGDVTKLGNALAEAQGDAKVAGKVGAGLGDLIGSVGQLIRNSTCKNMSFLIIKDEKGNVSAATRSL